MLVSDNFAKWNSGAWTYVGFDTPGTGVTAILVTATREIYISYSGTGTAVAPSLSIVTNAGSAKSYPTITIKGPSSGTSRIYELSNYTTGKSIYLNYTINSGETAVFTLIPGQISFVSDFQGNIIGKILPGSTLTDFALLPGLNNLGFFGASSTLTTKAVWVERCWSIDSSGT